MTPIFKEWETEPDSFDFVDEATQYACALRRNLFGAWCGYVAVPENHPWHGKSYNDKVPMPEGWAANYEVSVEEFGAINLLYAIVSDNTNEASISLLVRCHGGLTWAGTASFIDEGKAYWFGFDCSHLDDLSPERPYKHGIYRNMQYVIQNCKKAAACIKKFELAEDKAQ